MEISIQKYLYRLQEKHRDRIIDDHTWECLANITCLAFLVWKGIRGAAISEYKNLSDEVKMVSDDIIGLFPGLHSYVGEDNVYIFRDPGIRKILLDDPKVGTEEMHILLLQKIFGYLQPSTPSSRSGNSEYVVLSWSGRIGASRFSLYNENVTYNLPSSLLATQLRLLRILEEIGVTVTGIRIEVYE